MTPLAKKLEERVGAALRYGDVGADSKDRYSPLVGSWLRDLWERDGLLQFGRGKLWLVDPAGFESILAGWLPDWVGLPEPLFAFGRSAFGDLLISRGGKVWHLNVHYGIVTTYETTPDVFLYGMPTDYVRHAMDGVAATKAAKKLGALHGDEMFSFEPALSLGGEPTLANTRRVSMTPQLTILGQLFEEVEFR